MNLVSGVYAAVTTPMHDDYSCNSEALYDHCVDLMKRGCQGVVLFGTTGEGTSFSVAEREYVIKKMLRFGIDSQKVIVGISCCAIDDAVKLATLAVEQQCAAALIAPPFYFKNVDDKGVIQFYKNIIRSVNHPGLKILLYHIPQYSGVPITINVIKELRAEFPDTVIGIKESEGNLPFTKEILSTFPGFKVYVGREIHISEAVQLGAAGGISGLVNAFPELICSLYDYGKDPQQPNHNDTVASIVESLKNYPIFSAIKAIVESKKGSDWHMMRPPLVPLSEQKRQALTNVARPSR